MEMPVYQGRDRINTSVQYGGGSMTNSIMNQANASERLMARLKGNTQQITSEFDPLITEETVQKALKDVQEGKVDSESVAAVAQNVYRKTAAGALQADVEVQGHNIGKSLENQMKATGKYDVNAFTQSWGAFTNATTSGIKDPVIRSGIEGSLNNMGAKFTGSIGALQAEQQRALQTENFKAKLSMDVESLNSAFGVNNDEAVRLNNEISKTYNLMIEANLISPGMAQLEQKQIAKGAYISNIERGLTNAVNNGTAHRFYSQFKNADHLGILTPGDVEAIRSKVQSNIAADVNIYKNQLTQMQTSMAMTELQTSREFNERYIEGTLTPELVDQALRTNKIDMGTYDNYMKKVNQGGRIADDESKKLLYQVHVLDFTEDEIMDSPHLTNESKWNLIKQRRSEEGDQTNWLSSQNGKEARDRIKRTFNIIDGTLMSTMDFNNDNMRAYDDMYKKFYSEVESLPLEQRASKSLSIADKLVADFNETKNKEKETTRQKREEKKKAEEEKKAAAYGDSTYGKFMNMLENKKNQAIQIWEDFE